MKAFRWMRQALAWLLVGWAVVPASAFAAYPDKPIRLIVPAAPGGTTDIASRLIGKRMSELLGQPVVVENRAGGAGIDIIHVPYKGAAPAVSDLVAGQVTMMIDNLPSSLPHIQAGKLRALAVTSASRVAELPDVPTMKEAGLDDFQVTAWFGLVAPSGTPPAIIDQLRNTVAGILAEPAVKTRLAELGGVPGGDTPAHFADFIRSERERWARVVKDTGIAQQ